jgi:hypothetical protein
MSLLMILKEDHRFLFNSLPIPIHKVGYEPRHFNKLDKPWESVESLWQNSIILNLFFQGCYKVTLSAT